MEASIFITATDGVWTQDRMRKPPATKPEVASAGCYFEQTSTHFRFLPTLRGHIDVDDHGIFNSACVVVYFSMFILASMFNVK